MATPSFHSVIARRRARQKGMAIMEFAIIAPFMVTALLGVVGVGMTLGCAMQVNQVTRDTAHMFFDGVDFSLTSNQAIVGRLATGTGLASDAIGTINTSGNGVVILTQVIQVGSNQCNLGGYPPPNSGTCPNYGKLVIQKRIVIGNSTLRTSAFGTPTSSLLTGDGSIQPHDYCTDSSVVVPSTSPASSLSLAQDHYSFIVESYFNNPALSGFLANTAYSYAMM
jgi:TadE-like protein